MNENYLIALQFVSVACFISVTMTSPSVLVLLPAQFTFGNLPEHKLGFQQLNCRAVHRDFIYTGKLRAACLHCSWFLVVS